MPLEILPKAERKEKEEWNKNNNYLVARVPTEGEGEEKNGGAEKEVTGRVKKANAQPISSVNAIIHGSCGFHPRTISMYALVWIKYSLYRNVCVCGQMGRYMNYKFKTKAVKWAIECRIHNNNRNNKSCNRSNTEVAAVAAVTVVAFAFFCCCCFAQYIRIVRKRTWMKRRSKKKAINSIVLYYTVYDTLLC